MPTSLASVLAAHPDLGYAGFVCGHTDGRPRAGCGRLDCGKPEQPDLDALRDERSVTVIQAVADLLEPLRRTKTAGDRSPGSYQLKHLAEKRLDDHPAAQGYVSNGQLIAAALLCGFPVAPEGGGSPNAAIGLHRADLRDLERAAG